MRGSRYIIILAAGLLSVTFSFAESFKIVGTGQVKCFNESVEINPPKPGEPFFGQDAQNKTLKAEYTLSDDGLTVSDKNTGLTWQKSPETDGNGRLDSKDKLDWEEAQKQPARLNAAKFGGYSDWRLPSIKELYSLFDGRGTDLSREAEISSLKPFIDTKYFNFVYGDPSSGHERIIDSQYASSTLYVNKTMFWSGKLFGVNFADGRIKGYDLRMPTGTKKTFFVQCVRGNTDYGKNDFKDNKDGTITDRATGLIWSRADSGTGMNWEKALAWVYKKNKEKYLGCSDWRLPNIKELQSIVDYARSPDSSASPALNPLFFCTEIIDAKGQKDFPYFWSSTTHSTQKGGNTAMYVSFGRAAGWMPLVGLVDIHGAGAQRSDPKAGDPKDFPRGRGPQGDVIRIFNYVRLVRG